MGGAARLGLAAVAALAAVSGVFLALPTSQADPPQLSAEAQAIVDDLTDFTDFRIAFTSSLGGSRATHGPPGEWGTIHFNDQGEAALDLWVQRRYSFDGTQIRYDKHSRTKEPIVTEEWLAPYVADVLDALVNDQIGFTELGPHDYGLENARWDKWSFLELDLPDAWADDIKLFIQYQDGVPIKLWVYSAGLKYDKLTIHMWEPDVGLPSAAFDKHAPPFEVPFPYDKTGWGTIWNPLPASP